MKILCENGINYLTFKNIINNLRKVYEIKVIGDINNIAKALNDVQPELLLLKTESITGIVQAYSQKNNVKIIGFGDTNNSDVVADIVINKSTDILRPDIDTVSFKEYNTEKSGISVFVDNEESKFMADFLAINYDVNIFGKVKINSPKYLGIPTDIEKYEILNQSKYLIDLGSYDLYDAILLDTYPIVYTNHNLSKEYTTFHNLITLTNCMDFINVGENTDMVVKDNLNTLKSEFKKENSTTFTIELFNNLGFEKEAEILNIMLQENINDWISSRKW